MIASTSRRRTPRPEAERQLINAIDGWFAGQPCGVTVNALLASPWSSATFAGMRHYVLITLSGKDHRRIAAAFENGLAERQWALPSHYVADIGVTDCDGDRMTTRLTLDALTIRLD